MAAKSSETKLATLRWGIIGCGQISSWFVSDLCIDRKDAKAKHVIAAIGSSSIEKGQNFVAKHCPSQSPTVYGSYQEVYDSKDVDVIYVGTPHPMHYQNTLDSIAAGKHVLCEKPLAMNLQQSKKMMDAAKEKNVFLMEAVWTRFFPLARELQRLIHDEKVIGDVATSWLDFGLDKPRKSWDPNARQASKQLGAGALLDIGIYTLTWASIVMGQADPTITASMILSDDENIKDKIDEQVTAVLNYGPERAIAVCTASTLYKTPEIFGRIEGSKGSISIGGVAASKPGHLVLKLKGQEPKKVDFEVPGFGFHYEADAVALSIQARHTQNEICSWDTTLRIMSQMENIMGLCGLSYEA